MDLHDDFRFERFSFRDSHETVPKNSPHHYLILPISGSGRIETQAETLPLHPGQICYIPKGLRFGSSWQGNPHIEYLSFAFSNLPEAEQRAYELQVIAQTNDVLSLLQSLPTDPALLDSLALSRFYEALSQITKALRYSKSAAHSKLAEMAIHHIRRQPNAAIADIAKICGVSQSYLYTEFRNATGTTPNRYRNRILAQLAVELLTSTDMTVESISEKLEFSSPSYFRKVIRQLTGRTPSQIRSQLKEKR